MRVTRMPDGRELASYDMSDKKLCPLCNTFAVVPLTPDQLAAQPDSTTHVCHPAFGGCNHGFGPVVNVRFGTKYPDSPASSEYGTSYYKWWVGPAMLTDDEALGAFAEAHDVAYTEGHYGGPGRPFSRRASVRRSQTRVLVVQHGGLDI